MSRTGLQIHIHTHRISQYHAYTTLFWLTFIDYFSSMCIGLTSSSCKKHSSSSSSNHIICLILVISSPLSLVTCSSSSHYLQINRQPSFSISCFTTPFLSSQSASPKSDLHPTSPLTPSTSFLSDENVNLNTLQPGCPSDEG